MNVVDHRRLMRKVRSMLNGKNALKQKLAAGGTAIGLWVTLEAPSITEIAVGLGLDWITVDLEHGHLDFKELLEHVRVTRNTPTTPLVRIQGIEQGVIKRVLDIGAEGIIVPQVFTAAEVEQAVRFAKYPPRGIRGVGGERSSHWGMTLKESTASADRETMVIPMMETVAAGECIDAILDVPGVDAMFFGTVDYSASAGFLGEWEAPALAERLLAIKDKVQRRRVPCGVIAWDVANARARRAQGFNMIAVGADTGLLIRSCRDMMAALRQEDDR